MNTIKKQTPLIVALIALAVLAIGLGGFGFFSQQKQAEQQAELNAELNAEKEIIANELKELSDKYSEVEIENQELNEERDLAKRKVDSLVEVVENSDVKLSALRNYRWQLKKLKNEKVKLLQLNDSLLTVNSLMKDSLIEKDTKITKITTERNALYSTNVALNSEINRKKQLEFYNTKGEGVRIRKSGKVIVTDKVKKTSQLRVCTKIKADNQLISETKYIYFKVFNPNNILIGKLVDERDSGKRVSYTAKHKIFYKNQQLEVCKLIPIEYRELVSGKYKAEIYLNHELQDLVEFELD